MRRRSVWASAIAAAALTSTALVAAPAAQADPAPLTLIAEGFAGPLHVAFGPHHGLYVVNAFAGNVVRLDLADPDSPPDLVISGEAFYAGVDVRPDGTVYVSATLGAGGEGSTDPTALLRIDDEGAMTQTADLLAWEQQHNPDKQAPDSPDALSNPYSVLALSGRTLVADAAGNDIIEVRSDGKVKTLTVFPVITTSECAGRPNNDRKHDGCDPTPTDIEMGPDGYLYVSGLSGEGAGQGRIYKLDANNGKIVQTWTGFEPLTGIAVGPDGTIYAASLFETVGAGAPGSITRISPSGLVSKVAVPLALDVEVGHGMLVASSMTGAVFSVSDSAFG